MAGSPRLLLTWPYLISSSFSATDSIKWKIRGQDFPMKEGLKNKKKYDFCLPTFRNMSLFREFQTILSFDNTFSVPQFQVGIYSQFQSMEICSLCWTVRSIDILPVNLAMFLSSIINKLICYNPPFAYCYRSDWFADITTLDLFLHTLSNSIDSNKVQLRSVYCATKTTNMLIEDQFHFQRCWICQMLFISLLISFFIDISFAPMHVFQFLLIWREKIFKSGGHSQIRMFAHL